MRLFLSFLKWAGILLLALISGTVIYVLLMWDNTYDAPLPAIKADTDSTVIARGEYLVYGPMHCGECHTDSAGYAATIRGARVPLSGGFRFHLPFGDVYSKNITNDPTNGVGRYTDGEIARVIRHGVKPDGKTLIPFMNFQGMSDEDLTAVISYLRTTEPMEKAVPENEWNFFGKFVLTFILKPKGPTGTPVRSITPDTTAAYGEYLANNIANCRSCHTPLDMRTGKEIGEPFSGGNKMESATLEQNRFVYSQNLTPDAETGKIYGWSQADFIKRFREGKLIPESPMPWGPFMHFTDNDLKALYNYLQTLPPVHNQVSKEVLREG